jgi:ribose transport system substrate-binding protein
VENGKEKMIMKSLRIFFMSLLVVMCLAFTGFAADAPKPVIGFIPMTLSNEYFVIMVNAAKAEAAKQGVDLLVKAGSTHGSVDEQMQILEEMVATKGVQAICIVPSSSEGIINSLKMAAQAHIPIINLDTHIDPTVVKQAGLAPIPFLGTNNYDGAKMGGEYALNTLNLAGKKVAILKGIAEQQNAKDRRNGFNDAVAGKVTVVAEETANWDIEQGYTAFQKILQAQPDVGFVFASNDNMALGAVKVLQELGKKDVTIMGYDAIGAALDAIEKGEMAATVAQFPAEMGIQGVQLALAAIKGAKIPENTFTKTEVIDTTKVAEFKKYLGQFK